MAVSVGTYAKHDRDAFIDLHDDLLGGLTPDVFSWKYEQHPDADTPPLVVARDGDEVVGAVGALYVPFTCNGEPITASHPMDIMIDEEYRGARIFKELVDTLRESYDDISVEFGTGGRESRIAWERFGGWTYTDVDRNIRLQHPEALLDEPDSVVSALSVLAGGSLRALLKVRDTVCMNTESFDVSKAAGYAGSAFRIPNRWSPYPVSIRRESEYWTWRVSDPRLDTYTYWVAESGSPIASVLVACKSDTRRKDVIIALQDYRDDDVGFSALVSIYKQIIRDHRDATVFRTLNNSIENICRTTGLNHNTLIKNIGDNDLVRKITTHVDIASDVDEWDSKPVGYNWLDGTDGIASTEWEYSDLTVD